MVWESRSKEKEEKAEKKRNVAQFNHNTRVRNVNTSVNKNEQKELQKTQSQGMSSTFEQTGQKFNTFKETKKQPLPWGVDQRKFKVPKLENTNISSQMKLNKNQNQNHEQFEKCGETEKNVDMTKMTDLSHFLKIPALFLEIFTFNYFITLLIG